MPEAAFHFNHVTVGSTPFRHFLSSNILTSKLATNLHRWFEEGNCWSLTEADFYTQYEFSLLDIKVPEELEILRSPETIASISDFFQLTFNLPELQLNDITAHKLVDGHKISLHNDFINDAETHRLVVQINPDWKEDNGGYLMVFNSSDAKDIHRLIKPLVGSAFGFEISEKSFHAVSLVKGYSRYTLVYTFKYA